MQDSILESVQFKFRDDANADSVQDLIENITRLEVERAVKLHKKARALGLANDDIGGLGRGIGIYCTEGGMGKQLDSHRAGDPQKEEDFEKRDNTWLWKLPQGSFRVGHGGFHFYRKFIDSEGFEPFTQKSDGIVRVEGGDFTLWQNPEYQWNGVKWSSAELKEIQAQMGEYLDLLEPY